MLRNRLAGALLAAMILLAGCGGIEATGPGSSRVDQSPPGSSTAPSPPTVPTSTTVAPATPTLPAEPDPPMPDPHRGAVSTTTTITAVPLVSPMLEPGATGAEVRALQDAMARAGFFRDEVDGVFGERTAAAVVAVHKAFDLARSGSWAAADWDLLAAFTGPAIPERPDEPDRLEIDLTRQLLYRVDDETVVDIIPISSGNGELYENASGRLVRARTPRGDFSLYKRYDGWRISYLGALYRPWYFSGGYAIHGSSSVPAEPASHGCVRVPNWEADHLAEVLGIGLPVHVWD